MTEYICQLPRFYSGVCRGAVSAQFVGDQRGAKAGRKVSNREHDGQRERGDEKIAAAGSQADGEEDDALGRAVADERRRGDFAMRRENRRTSSVCCIGMLAVMFSTFDGSGVIDHASDC